MIEVGVSLPKAALVSGQNGTLTGRLSRMGAHWFSFESALVDRVDGDIRSVTARTGDLALKPVDGWDGSGRIETCHGADMLAGTARMNAGLRTEGTLEGETLGLAVIFSAPHGPAGTLWCVDTVAGESAIHLTHEDDGLALRDRRGSASATSPLPGAPGDLHLVFAQLGPDRVTLMAGGAQVSAAMPASFAPGAAHVFIGCRRDRAGLTKSLGGFRIADVLAFPDLDLCDPTAGRDARLALQDYIARVFEP